MATRALCAGNKGPIKDIHSNSRMMKEEAAKTLVEALEIINKNNTEKDIEKQSFYVPPNKEGVIH